MKRRHLSGRSGGVSIFLCILLSAVILIQGTLYYAARIRAFEAELNRCMRLQISQILSLYNDDLLSKYGLYALDAASVNTEVFDTCFSGGSDTVLETELLSPLSADSLRTGISDYMQIRMPAAVSGEILSRFKGVCSEITSCGLFQKAKNANSSAWLDYVRDFLSQKDKWSDVISKAVSVAEAVDITGKLRDLEKFASSFRSTMERSATLNLQGRSTGDLSNQVLNPKGLSQIMGYVDSFMDTDLPEFTDTLIINQYAQSFLDSKLEYMSDGDVRISECNILGVPFSEIHGSNRADLEYVLTGLDNEFVSFNAAKAMIGDVRLIINFGTYLLDQEKMNKAKEIAEILSTAVAAASLGTVVVDPEILQFVVVYVWAMGQAITDVFSLIEGESVLLFDHSAVADGSIFEDALMTSYRDYLGFFLLAVPVEWKLSRILTILKKDCAGELYEGIRLSTGFRGYKFCMEDTYDAYSSE